MKKTRTIIASALACSALGLLALAGCASGPDAAPSGASSAAAGGQPAVELQVFATRLTDEHTTLPAGTLLPDTRRMAAATADGRVLELLSVRAAGRKRMAAADFLRVARLPEGSRLY